METEVKESQVEVIARKSGLEKSKAQQILDKFKGFFQIAADWEERIKVIQVTDASQVEDMKLARTARLVLKETRIAAEATRYNLKENHLREGQVIDGIAKTLKGLLIPMETHLKNQEDFIKIQEEKKVEAHRISVEKRMEEERLALEKATMEKEEAERQDRIRIQKEELDRKEAENERLRKEAEVLQKRMLAERKEAQDKRNALAVKEKKKREAVEEEARIEREKMAEERRENAKKQQEAVEKEHKARAEAERQRREKERLEKLKTTCPECGATFTRELK